MKLTLKTLQKTENPLITALHTIKNQRIEDWISEGQSGNVFRAI